MTEDQQLLQRYVRHAMPEALDELVRRYRDLVYSSALRQVRDAHLAEDVAQAVFIVLSKKASTIRLGVALGGWLLAVTRRAALNAMKKQAIQHRHERAAAKTEVFETAEANWEQIDPVLDAVMSRLSSKERDAVVLRYFQDRSFAQVGAELGLSEEAARKRVERAIERMRGLLKRQGVFVGAAALGTTITSHAVHAAPTTIVAASTSTSAANLAKGVMTMMTLTKLKAVAVAAAMFLLISGGAALVVTAMAQQPDATAQNHPSPPTTSPFDPNSAREAILLRFQSFQNFSVSYHMESVAQVVAGRASGVSSATTTQPATSGTVTMSEDHYLSLLGDKFRSEFENHVGRAAPDTSKPDAMRTISVSSGDRTESLMELTRAGQPQRTGIINPSRTTSIDWVGWVLGLGSSKNNNDRLNFADIALMDLVPGPNGDVILRQTDDTKTIAEWEFRPGLGYVIVAYRAIVQPETRPNIEVTAEDFRSGHGLMLPYTFHLRFASMRNGQWTETQRITATVKEYKLNDPDNTDQRYHITWPAGTKVVDTRSNTPLIAGDDGKLNPVGK